MAEAPVILIANIDKGGVFADIVGTLELLESEERDRIKGIVINKFRGDVERFKSGIDFIESYTNKPVLGVIPYSEEINLPEEDCLISDEFGSEDYQIEIAIIYLPHISNFTDFDFLAYEPETKVRYLRKVSELGKPDLIIIPGSKNTIGDLEYLYQIGMVKKIQELYQEDTLVIGICGGYQILGKKIKDPLGIETGKKGIDGIGLLDIETILAAEKITSQVKAWPNNSLPFIKGNNRNNNTILNAYEIHQGRTERGSQVTPLFQIVRNGSDEEVKDGAISVDDMAWGTYLHGLFDNDFFRRSLINFLRKRKGLKPLQDDSFSAKKERENAYNQFAELVHENLDMDLLQEIIFCEH